MSKIEEMAAEDSELRKGPWTVEEDGLLAGYIASHGEGRWNLLARCSGLKRSGKSCRLRWLNYLKPDVKRGDLTPGEQLCILELHSKWGNRWSRIAQYLPGRTDNEIKNYWRTRVQKQARQLNIDANSEGFRDAVRRVWMPRLIQQMQSSSSATTPTNSPLAFLNQGPPQASLQDSMRSDYRTRNNSNCSEKSSSMEDCCPSTSSGSMMRRISQYPEMTDFLESSPSSDFSCNTLDDPRFLRDSYVDTSYNLEAENLVSASTQELDYGASRLSMNEMSWADDMTENLWNMDELRLIMDQQGRGSPF